LKKIAAIDIGSNAVRILICYVIQSENQDIFQKNSYLRLPLRLGEDSFRDGIISDKKIKTLSEALISFKYIMRVHNVDEYQIYATSALRESKNYLKVISEVEETSGLKINLINGLKEAKIIAKGNPLSKLEFNKTYLYVDVGGGSTEYSILRRGLDKKSKSFKIGTVRLLNNTINPLTINEIKKWLKSNIEQNDKVKLFATGGNINKIQTMTSTKTGKPISYISLKDLLNNVQIHSFKERMIKYDLNPDRADVIIPALEIFILTMESVRSNKMFIPKVGLVDGMIKEIFYEKNGCKLDP
jgi:exopolyphosphatase/guanosine-5'-triphosphate,3'-diphosphate pyrophosphatase